jgi:iron complex outermembrane receptor protein
VRIADIGLSAATCLALVPVAGVQAQTSTGAEASASGSGGRIEEVVVTAERRSQNIQKAPIAITAITARQLAQQGVTNGTDLVGLVPGVKISTERGTAMFFIRGIGSVGGNPYTNPDVTYNVDGQTYDLPTGPNGSLYDVARVEVLKGPQGTLYGANAAAGAINIITNDPTQRYAANIEVRTGNYGLIQSTGMVNIPVSPSLALRGAFQTVNHDGYVQGNNTDDADDLSGRVKALWTPTADLRVMLSADYYRQGGNGTQRVPLNADGSYYFGAPWTVQRYFPVPGGETELLPPGVFLNNQNKGVWGQIDYNLGFATLTAVPSFRQMTEGDYTCDLGFCFAQNESDRAETLEVRLKSNEGATPGLTWVAGVYGRAETLPNYTRVQQSFPVIGSGVPEGIQRTLTPRDSEETLAAFAQATYSVLDWLHVTAGVRYNHDQKEEHGYTINDNLFGTPPAVGTYNTDYAVKSNRPTFRVGVDATVAPNSIVYANLSTGYKVGGFGASPDPSPTLPPNPYATYKPEEIIAYDVGTKNEFLDRRLQVNAELFYWIYYSQQVNTIFLFPQTIGVAIVPSSVNAGHGDDKGLDLDAAYVVTDADRVNGSFEYLDASYSSFVYPFLFMTHDNSGRPFNYAPRASVNLGYSHSFNFAGGADLVFAANTHLTTSYWVDYNYMNHTGKQSGYHKTDLDLTYTAANGKWYVGAWVKNLENAPTKSFTGGDLPGSPNLQWTELDAPQTYGVTLGAKF